VCLLTESVRKTNAEYQATFRNSAKGEAAKRKRSARLKAARAARRAYRNDLLTRANRARAITFDGRYGGPFPDGCPRIGELKMTDFMAALHA
jgi:hypothetical protein